MKITILAEDPQPKEPQGAANTKHSPENNLEIHASILRRKGGEEERLTST